MNPWFAPTLLLTAAAFLAGNALRRFYPRLTFALGALLAVPCVVSIAYYIHIFDHWVWFYQVRSLRFSEFSFAGVGWLGGACFNWHARDGWRAGLLVPACTLAAVTTPFLKSMLDPVDVRALHDRCQGEVCLQSSPATCGPSSAASILRSLGGPANERDLAEASYTSRTGTEAWYLARALRRRGYKATFTFQHGLPYPAIAGVRLQSGEGHFIAILRSSESGITIVDPMYGEATLRPEDLAKRYRFTGMFLKIEVPRH